MRTMTEAIVLTKPQMWIDDCKKVQIRIDDEKPVSNSFATFTFQWFQNRVMFVDYVNIFEWSKGRQGFANCYAINARQQN